MESPRVLFICSEIFPYVPETYVSKACKELPPTIQEKGFEIRTFMPRYGCINERRNQLHEVIRLSGMNLIIGDVDHTLIIKVASISALRMQIYFIDNEDFFQRKFVLKDKNDKFFDDSDERSIFFIRGVLETARKLRWSPDIVHCNGWLSCLGALYVKKMFKNDPLYANAKVVLSVFNEELPKELNPNFKEKVLVDDGVEESDLVALTDDTYESLIKMCISHSDGLIIAEDNVNPDFADFAAKNNTPVLPFVSSDVNVYSEKYAEFYNNILEK